MRHLEIRSDPITIIWHDLMKCNNPDIIGAATDVPPRSYAQVDMLNLCMRHWIRFAKYSSILLLVEKPVVSIRRHLGISMVTQFQWAFSCIMYFHVLLLLWPYACIAVTESPELFTNATGDVSRNFTLNQPGSLVNTTIPDNSTTGQIANLAIRCATPPTWDAPTFYREDCLGAIDLLYFETCLTECYSQPCTFYGRKANSRIQKDDAQPTPRMYTFGKIVSNGLATILLFLQIYQSTTQLL